MKTKSAGTIVKKDRRNYLRQLDIFDPAKFGNVEINIIGAGGIGSFVAIALAKLGLERITIWDGDKVEPHNLPNQFHSLDQVGVNKAVALVETVYRMTGARVTFVPNFWSKEGELEGVVIAAVDHMEKTKVTKTAGRIEIWKEVKNNPNVSLYVDGRIGGQALRVLAIRPLADTFKYEGFEQRMFSQDQAKELPCTARNIIDVGFQMAALITNTVRKFLVSGRVEDHDIIMDMASLTLLKMSL